MKIGQKLELTSSMSFILNPSKDLIEFEKLSKNKS